MKNKSAKVIMVLGTSSGAGKSLLVSALCRYYANMGFRVAPFKAQNMSNNARVVEGGEIGSAQYFQALAAKTTPTVFMNPLLLKPEKDNYSQVILLGKVNKELANTPWLERHTQVWQPIINAFDQLAQDFEIIIVEGAGSPAEINLYKSDVVNNNIAEYTKANCLLISDIDRGGAFAHLYGTWSLMPTTSRAQICGFILNKFRGDANLLAPAPQMLEELTGIKTVGILPMYFGHGLPEEDQIFHHHYQNKNFNEIGNVKITKIVIIKYPYISNSDEFQNLLNINSVQIIWAQTPELCQNANIIILPGSKNTTADLAWLYKSGIDKAIIKHHQNNKMILGICGGLQILGNELIENNILHQGLGILPITTIFAEEKTVVKKSVVFNNIKSPWQKINNINIDVYEIHQGKTTNPNESSNANNFWQNPAGNILATYFHGIFENESILKNLFGENIHSLDMVFNNLSHFVENHIGKEFLQKLLYQTQTQNHMNKT